MDEKNQKLLRVKLANGLGNWLKPPFIALHPADKLFLVTEQPENFWLGERFVGNHLDASVNNPGNRLPFEV